MNQTALVTGSLLISALLAGCGNAASTSGSSSAGSSKPAGSAAPSAKAAAASAAPKGDASAEPAHADAEGSAAPAHAGGDVKGLKPGFVVVGYLTQDSSPNECVIATEHADKKISKEDMEAIAKAMSAKVVESCPTEGVLGTCDVGLGLLDQYYGPKFTAESAKKDCTSKPHQTWVE